MSFSGENKVIIIKTSEDVYMDVNKVPFLGLTHQVSQTVQQSGLAPSQRITSMEQTQSTLTENYGAFIDPTFMPVSRENFRYGLSGLKFGALGKDAINGKIGGKLNIQA